MLLQKSIEYWHLNVRELLKGLLGSAVLFLSAQVTVPLIPVPLTLQTMAVLFIASLGAEQGTLAVLLYLLEGMFGLPVFAGLSFGIHEILGPTGGYLLGFIPAVYLSGTLLQKSHAKGFMAVFFAGLVGISIVLICGYLRLACFVGFSKAYILGIAPFFLTELLKLLVFSLLTVNKLEHDIP
ncbi:MAG: biotin transporter BioY [Puniceicoccales bacterium]|jgi:biotin transport system substrate-specific component|nr:biotin transporter BioY [Puniceicoccales bacterium]